MVKEEWKKMGYIDEPVDDSCNLKKEIRRLCKEKDAIILAHYYTVGDPLLYQPYAFTEFTMSPALM